MEYVQRKSLLPEPECSPFYFCSSELSQGMDTQFLIQLLDSRLSVNENKNVFPRIFFPLSAISELKKEEGMIE